MTPQALLELAQSETEAPVSSKSKTWPYLESAHVLRQKGWMWSSIVKWMDGHVKGMPSDRKVWQEQYSRWCKANNTTPVRQEGRQ